MRDPEIAQDTLMDRMIVALTGISLVCTGLFALVAALVIGCTAQQDAKVESVLSRPSGQLFCQLEAAGGDRVVALVDIASLAVPGGQLISIIATGAAKSYVDEMCAQAGRMIGGIGVPVSPPADPATAQLMPVIVPPR